MTDTRRGRLAELLVVFGTLGFIGFGGPAAHIALMRREVVERLAWLTDAQLVDLVGITNLIPGPNSTEMAMHVGRLRAGGTGLVVAASPSSFRRRRSPWPWPGRTSSTAPPRPARRCCTG